MMSLKTMKKVIAGVVALLFLNVSLFTLAEGSGAEGSVAEGSVLFEAGIYLIPYPREVSMGGGDFLPGKSVSIVLDKNASEEDRFAASEMVARLKEEWGIEAAISDIAAGPSIILTRKGVSKNASGMSKKQIAQKYELSASAEEVVIKAKTAQGLFYGTQTLLQVFKRGPQGPYIPGMTIADWPDIVQRACHYDTKHHQDKREYVEGFIRDLARYKINMLVWEWEDKFEYPSHPEIGAPGAFTMEEMQELTRYAQKYHIQIVPLVQGLGHVSYILKWPQHAHLREIPASNWEFCPHKEGTYVLLNDLWMDAIEATPGSEYIHIGTDESYELGKGVECGCLAEVERDGKHSMMTKFISRSVKPLMKEGRIPMAWSAQYVEGAEINPPEGMVLDIWPGKGDDYYEVLNERDYELFIYDPNPGIEPLFLPYFYRLRGEGDQEKEVETALERSHNPVSKAAVSGNFEGMINTSWDDAGLHNQMWMMSFINSAEWSWSGGQPDLDEFAEKFFLNYYGEQSKDMKELYLILNKASYYYWKSFERRVWHYGDIGLTTLPVLPRGDNLEYDEYWNREYAQKIKESHEQAKQMERAREIILANQEAGARNSYDFELFTSIVDLVDHTCNTYLTLSRLEKAIKEAHNQRFLSHKAAYAALEDALGLIDANLAEREEVYRDLVTIWEKTRLPKGMSTDEKEFFHRQDRARHFAFRKADMSYLIYDEELLGLEKYREGLLAYMEYYRDLYLQQTSD